jgi:hypothetical protein
MVETTYLIRTVPSPYRTSARVFAETSPADKRILLRGVDSIIIVQKQGHIERLLKIRAFFGQRPSRARISSTFLAASIWRGF